MHATRLATRLFTRLATPQAQLKFHKQCFVCSGCRKGLVGEPYRRAP
jgi:hypothetical protein